MKTHLAILLGACA